MTMTWRPCAAQKSFHQAGVATDLVRVTVSASGGIASMALPSRIPLAELLVGMVETTRSMTSDDVHLPRVVMSSGGQPLDPDVSLLAQGVRDGDLLMIEIGPGDGAVPVCDDLAEAVADQVDEIGDRWTPRDATRSVAGAAVLLLALALVLLATQPAGALGRGWTAAVGGGILLVAVLALARFVTPQAAVIAGAGASAYGALAALQLAGLADAIPGLVVAVGTGVAAGLVASWVLRGSS